MIAPLLLALSAIFWRMITPPPSVLMPSSIHKSTKSENLSLGEMVLLRRLMIEEAVPSRPPPSFAKELKFLPGEVVMGAGKPFLIDPKIITICVLDGILDVRHG